MTFEAAVALSARVMEGAGILTIVGGALVAGVLTLARAKDREGDFLYRTYRRLLGRAILLGLELLVAADIIRTVAEAPTLEGVTILAIIVLIRTFLSFTLTMELEGRWPWQLKRKD